MSDLRLLLLLLTLLVPATLLAQEPQQHVRLELPFEAESSRLEVMALPDSSLLVYSRKSDIWLRNPTYTLEKYNAQLEQVWTSQLEMKSDYDFVRHYTELPYSYLIFQGIKPDNYIFVRIDLVNGGIKQTEFVLEKLEQIHEFSVLHGKYFIIANNRYDQRPSLLYLDPNDPKPVMLPSVYGSESSFSDLLTDPAQGRADVVLTESNGRISRLQVKSFSPAGKLLRNYFILQQDNRALLNGEITPGDTLSQMLVGTYGIRDLRYAQGFFTTPVASDLVSGEFYSFLQLQNFYKYMKPRREERTRKREFARLSEGKDPVNRYRLLLHNLIVTPYGYVLAAEVYFPQYRNTSTYLDPRLRNIDRTAQGYKRTHAVALGFDKDGILLWDNAFPLPDMVTLDLVHAIEVGSLPDGRIVMAYPDGSKIYYRIMAQSRYTDKEEFLTLLPYKEDEKISGSVREGLIHWYGSHFAAFGYQHIRSSSSANRSIFYINKISF